MANLADFASAPTANIVSDFADQRFFAVIKAVSAVRFKGDVSFLRKPKIIFCPHLDLSLIGESLKRGF